MNKFLTKFYAGNSEIKLTFQEILCLSLIQELKGKSESYLKFKIIIIIILRNKYGHSFQLELGK